MKRAWMIGFLNLTLLCATSARASVALMPGEKPWTFNLSGRTQNEQHLRITLRRVFDTAHPQKPFLQIKVGACQSGLTLNCAPLVSREWLKVKDFSGAVAAFCAKRLFMPSLCKTESMDPIAKLIKSVVDEKALAASASVEVLDCKNDSANLQCQDVVLKKVNMASVIRDLGSVGDRSAGSSLVTTVAKAGSDLEQTLISHSADE